MYHPLYPIARGMVGRPVYAHHMNGTTFYGVLQSVAPHGVYLLNARRVALAGATMPAANGEYALAEQVSDNDVDLVYAPGAYFAFGALTGLTLGALASPWW